MKHKKIVKVLSQIDEKIELNKKINNHLTIISSNIFQQLLYSEEEEFIELQDVCKFIKGCKPNKISKQYHEGFMNYLTIYVLLNQSQMYAYDKKDIKQMNMIY